MGSGGGWGPCKISEEFVCDITVKDKEGGKSRREEGEPEIKSLHFTTVVGGGRGANSVRESAGTNKKGEDRRGQEGFSGDRGGTQV